ncbi:MAG TPA: GNAT family N-acetyltransferase [Coriobacteriia bacterium]|nr:GNAT family N-acetyltransferase [Coriobacteriia bacterium]
MSGADRFTYSLERGPDALASLEREWIDLENACASHPFQTHAYVTLWQREVGAAEGVRPLIVTARDGERLVGIFPASFRVIRGMPAITWLSGPEILDYGDILFCPDGNAEQIDAFVERALTLLTSAERLATLYLTNLRADALAYAPLAKRLRVLKVSAAPFLKVEGQFEDYMSGRKHALSGNLDRKLRKMEREHGAELEILEPGDPRIEETMEALVRYQRVRFNRMTARTALFHEHQVRFRLLQAMTLPDSRLLRIAWSDHIPAASLHAMRDDRLYNLTGGFDAESSKFSPGSILQRFAIESCFASGVAIYDFCWGGEPYKYDWASGEVSLTTFIDNGLRGRALTAVRAVSRRMASALDPQQKDA